MRRMPARGSECSPTRPLSGARRKPPAGFQAFSPLLEAWIGVYRALVTADLPFHRGNPAETVLVQK